MIQIFLKAYYLHINEDRLSFSTDLTMITGKKMYVPPCFQLPLVIFNSYFPDSIYLFDDLQFGLLFYSGIFYSNYIVFSHICICSSSL